MFESGHEAQLPIHLLLLIGDWLFAAGRPPHGKFITGNRSALTWASSPSPPALSRWGEGSRVPQGRVRRRRRAPPSKGMQALSTLLRRAELPFTKHFVSFVSGVEFARHDKCRGKQSRESEIHCCFDCPSVPDQDPSP